MKDVYMQRLALIFLLASFTSLQSASSSAAAKAASDEKAKTILDAAIKITMNANDIFWLDMPDKKPTLLYLQRKNGFTSKDLDKVSKLIARIRNSDARATLLLWPLNSETAHKYEFIPSDKYAPESHSPSSADLLCHRMSSKPQTQNDPAMQHFIDTIQQCLAKKPAQKKRMRYDREQLLALRDSNIEKPSRMATIPGVTK